MTKYHINSKGIPAICQASPGKCPFGDHTEHFPTREMAQTYADIKYKKEYGTLAIDISNASSKKGEEVSGVVREAISKHDEDYLAQREHFLLNESSSPYIKRCRSVKRLKGYKPKRVETTHYSDDRKRREENLVSKFGHGKLIGYYEVDHLQENTGEYKKQVIEVRDTGRMCIYDLYSGKRITTFMGHRSRLEAMFVLSGEIVDEDFLVKANRNRDVSLSQKLN